VGVVDSEPTTNDVQQPGPFEKVEMRTSPGVAAAWLISDLRDDCARLTNLTGARETRPISIRRKSWRHEYY
jgi:hypothetical protein